MRSRFLYLIAATFVASCGLHPAYAQTPQQVVGQQLDKLTAVSKANDSAVAALAAWTARIGATRLQLDSVTTTLRAMLAALSTSATTPPPVVVVTPPPVVVSPVDTAKPPIVTAYIPVLREDFTGYTSTAQLRASPALRAGLNPQGIDLDTLIKFLGHATARYNQTVTPGAAQGETPQPIATLPRSVTKAWIRFVVRYMPGYTTVGTTPKGAAHAYKLLGWGWPGGIDGSARIEFTNTNQYTLNWAVSGRSATAVGPFVEYNGPNVASEWTDGQWYQYIVYYEPLSSTTVRQRWWLSKVGETPKLMATIVGTMTKGSVQPITYITPGMNLNQVPAKPQFLNVGVWEVVDGAQYPNPFGVAGL